MIHLYLSPFLLVYLQVICTATNRISLSDYHAICRKRILHRLFFLVDTPQTYNRFHTDKPMRERGKVVVRISLKAPTFQAGGEMTSNLALGDLDALLLEMFQPVSFTIYLK